MESDHYNVIYTDMLIKYARKGVYFIKNTDLLQQFKALNEDQNIWIKTK